MDRQMNSGIEEYNVVVTEVSEGAASGMIKDAHTGIESNDPTVALLKTL